MARDYTKFSGQAHRTLDRIQQFQYTPDRSAIGFNYEDGSALALTDSGWMIVACVAGCVCILGKREKRLADKEAMEASH